MDRTLPSEPYSGPVGSIGTTQTNGPLPPIDLCSALLLGPGVALTTPAILATCTRPAGHDGKHRSDVEW